MGNMGMHMPMGALGMPMGAINGHAGHDPIGTAPRRIGRLVIYYPHARLESAPRTARVARSPRSRTTRLPDYRMQFM